MIEHENDWRGIAIIGLISYFVGHIVISRLPGNLGPSIFPLLAMGIFAACAGVVKLVNNDDCQASKDENCLVNTVGEVMQGEAPKNGAVYYKLNRWGLLFAKFITVINWVAFLVIMYYMIGAESYTGAQMKKILGVGVLLIVLNSLVRKARGSN